MALISLDASSPVAVRTASSSNTATVTTASFTPPANKLLVGVLVVQYANQQADPTMSISDTAGGAWTSRAAANNGGSSSWGQVQIWTRPATTSPGSITVTGNRGTLSPNGASASLYVAVLTGAAIDQTPAAATATYTTAVSDADQAATVNAVNAFVILGTCLAGTSAGGGWSADARTTSIDAWDDTSNVSSNLIGRATNPTAATGTVTLGFTSGRTTPVQTAYAALEVVPAPVWMPPISYVSRRRAANW